MTVNSLQVLADNRKALLLAEVAAWLHDMGKCADEHIINQASDKPNGYSYKYKTAQSYRLPSSLPDINLLGETVSVKDLIEKGMPKIISDTSQPWVLRVLGRCHSAAHVEKELSDKDTSTKQPKDKTRLSTAFGVEGNPVTGLTDILSRLPFNSMQDRGLFAPQVERAFESAFGDTRRPINEVALVDWSGAVASLYKSAIAGALLGVKPPNPDDIRWRILRVNFDVLGLYAKAIKIADLLGYQRAVDEACEGVKKLIEEEYPLGNEIYRDTTGIYFTFPDLDLPADLAQEIRRRVEEAEMELAPRIDVTIGDGNTAQEQLKGILAKARKEALEDIKKPFDSNNFSNWQREWEQDLREPGRWERCPLCGLRPKREKDEVCAHCQRRRVSRIETWRATPAQTIWIGEVADHNDRVALLVGRFGLEGWLSGELVQTMLVKAAENDPAACQPKNPSPARLRRVWQTCQDFWQKTVLEEIIPQALGEQKRKYIVPKETNWKEELYNGKVNGKPLDLYWLSKKNAFLTVSSLDAAGDFKPGDNVTLKDPDSNKAAGEFTVQKIEDAGELFAQYQPWLSLLAAPDQFLVFLPASKALEIVQKIQKQYADLFGKVRNRLPLALGVVYFERKMPLMAVMDSARQMLEKSIYPEQWTVSSTNGNGQIEFANGIAWDVPVVMGDGQTEDLWYPYFELAGESAAHHTRCFEVNGKTWVHVKNLQKGDIVNVSPSTFDFLWLDTAARRFDVAYDENGRRPARPTRPIPLERLTQLEDLWGKFSKLTQSQQKQVLQTIETARERWGIAVGEQAEKDEVFCQFVEETLAEAGLVSLRAQRSSLPAEQAIASPPGASRNDTHERLIQAAVRGELADLAELHLEILKEKA